MIGLKRLVLDSGRREIAERGGGRGCLGDAGPRETVCQLAQLDRGDHQQYAQHDRPGGYEPEQRQESRTGEDRGNHAEDRRCRPRGDQQPFIVEDPAELNRCRDPSEPSDNRPGGNPGKGGQSPLSSPNDDNQNADEHADDALRQRAALADPQPGNDVDGAFDQGKGRQQEDEHTDRQSGPDKGDDAE